MKLLYLPLLLMIVVCPVAHGVDWSETPNYSELRERIGWSEDFVQKCEADRPLRKMAEHMKAEEWAEAAAMGSSWLARCPVDMGAHYYTGVALDEQGAQEAAAHHFRWANGLMDSVVSSGDGRSPETAFETISIAEGYDALYFFGLKPTDQALIRSPIMVDLITVTNDEGEQLSVFFRPAAHFDRLSRLGRELAQ